MLMSGNDPSGPSGGPGRRPWFGPRRYGFGYRPQTWQGALIMAVLLGPVVIVAVVLRPRSPAFVLAVVPGLVVPYVVMAVQRRAGRGQAGPMPASAPDDRSIR
jgi:hypothetical protein